MAFKLKSGHPYTSVYADCFDDLAGQHGNYQPMKNQSKCVEYVTKDGDFVDWPEGAARALQAKQKVTFLSVAESILYGRKRYRDIILDAPGFALQHRAKILPFEADVAKLQAADALLPWQGLVEPVGRQFFPHEQAVADWLEANVKAPLPRPIKTPQLYVWGPPNAGKSSMVQRLSQHLRIYYMPKGESFYDFYDDRDFDLIVFDEFKAQKTITEMNSWLSGEPIALRIKGGQRMKRKNLPVLILSNYSPAQAYSNSSEMALAIFMTRFHCVQIPSSVFRVGGVVAPAPLFRAGPDAVETPGTLHAIVPAVAPPPGPSDAEPPAAQAPQSRGQLGSPSSARPLSSSGEASPVVSNMGQAVLSSPMSSWEEELASVVLGSQDTASASADTPTPDLDWDPSSQE